MNNDIIDFSAITACGECCVGCKKKENGICRGNIIKIRNKALTKEVGALFF